MLARHFAYTILYGSSYKSLTLVSLGICCGRATGCDLDSCAAGGCSFSGVGCNFYVGLQKLTSIFKSNFMHLALITPRQLQSIRHGYI